MSSSAPNTRMRLRKQQAEAESSQDDSAADSSETTGRSSKNETKRAPTRKSGKKPAVEAKTEVTMTTRKRGKKVTDAEEETAEEVKYKVSTSKGRGKKRGVATFVEDSQVFRIKLETEEPMDTQSDPSSDDIRSQVELLPSEATCKRGLRRKGQAGNDKESSESSSSKSSGKETSKGSRLRGRREVKQEAKEEENETIEKVVPTKRSRRTKTSLKEEQEDTDHMSNDKVKKVDSISTTNGQKQKTSKGKKVVSKSSAAKDDIKIEPTKTDAVQGGKRNPGKCVGAHCSIAGGLWNAVSDAVSMGAKSFALFLRSQRQWQAKPLEDENAAKFREACRKHGFPPHLILPHGSYLLNCGSPNPTTLSKSRESLIDEMSRCQKLGLTLYNFHPGSTCGDIQIEECLDKIGESINMALAKTSGVTAVIENMSRQGHTIGGDFEELRAIINRVQDKSRIGVCLDTCHAFAAGYDLSTETGFHQMMAEFERLIGFQYLKGVHINDSKGLVGCHKDRHENIGKGHIGLAGFRRLMNDPRFDNIPLILETPIELGYAKEIKILNSLVK